MKIDILGGKDEIGGNKILVEHKGTRILLDFGMSFCQAGKYFSEFLQPRKCSALTDFFELGLLPDIPGIYREDYLTHMGKSPEKRSVDAVFLTHAHADHAQYIHFLRWDIPVFSTEATKIILQCLEETGINSLSDFIAVCEDFKFYKNKKEGLSRVTKKQKEFVHERDFNIMEPDKKVKIGSLEIEMIPVDHSLPGACGYIIYSDEGTLVYTGDIRFHGYNQGFSRKFVEKAKLLKPKWLLCEGTRIDEEDQDSEEEVMKQISSIISKTKGLVFVEHPVRDLDRVNSIFKAAKENKRDFVVNLKQAYLIGKLGKLSPFSLDDVKILVPKKGWGLIDTDAKPELIEQDYSREAWQKEFLNMKNSIVYKELQNNPSKYVVSMSFWEINQLTDIQPKDAVWIKSNCEPFCDDMELDEKRKKNWLEHFKIDFEFEFTHASGHASGGEIKGLIKEINPEILIPVHTQNPELFEK